MGLLDGIQQGTTENAELGICDHEFRIRHPSSIHSLSQVALEIGDADHQQHGQIDRPEDQAECTEIFPADITAAVVDRAGASRIRRNDTHQTERVAKQQRDPD
jgi:hypothetical protein